MSSVSDDGSSSSPPSATAGIRAPLDGFVRLLEPLEDDDLLADPQAVREYVSVLRARGKDLDQTLLNLAIESNSGADRASSWSSRRRERPDAPDPQVMRAITDVRTLRAETVHERKARRALEADLHREVVETVRLLVGFLERRWRERVTQCRMAARLAARLAESAGLAPEQTRAVQVGTLLQDVGLIALPDGLLRVGTVGLSPAERSVYQQHPVIAQEALGTGAFAEIGDSIRHHHERWDGAGYPEGLAGDAIPIAARVVAVVTGYVEATTREGGTAITWRRDQVASGAFDPSLLRLLEQAVRQRNG
jgi:response regulator RpfG family c-di-GMP phosphodiesterase